MPGKLYFITGLSGAGKTTIGTEVYKRIKATKDNVVLLDGDVMKNAIEVYGDIDYSAPARKERALRYAGICAMLTAQDIDVVCCTISMYDDVRTYNREHNENYLEVFLDVPVEVLMKRDQKGLYSKYKNGESVDLAGINVDVEFPKNPDIVIVNDGTVSVEECVEVINKKPI